MSCSAGSTRGSPDVPEDFRLLREILDEFGDEDFRPLREKLADLWGDLMCLSFAKTEAPSLISLFALIIRLPLFVALLFGFEGLAATISEGAFGHRSVLWFSMRLIQTVAPQYGQSACAILSDVVLIIDGDAGLGPG
jgi:hypothetical protein